PLSSEPPLSTEKASIVGQVRQFTKCATSGKMRNISQKRQCRASGFVLGLKPDLLCGRRFAWIASVDDVEAIVI
ncbi:hypothetical protein, partial [Yoonia sp. R2-816]|uniref:hypothetical protein n=1 Tax=Yoonia sp. R2-816 TaxID=3342638 RepID=UPI00372C1CD0